MQKNTEKVPVARIVEYPWRLGERCHLLLENGLHPYYHTEEEISDLLEESSANPDMLSFCMESSRCAKFHQCFQNGKTPFAEKDPIILLEYGGDYWAHEGKHRVCMAKRMGVKYIDARVIPLPSPFLSLLDPVGVPGTFSFSATFGIRSKGEIAVLWLKPGKEDHRAIPCSFGPQKLNSKNAKEQEETEIIKGVFVGVKKEKEGWGKEEITANVRIEKEHENTRIWLYSLPIGKERKGKKDIYSISGGDDVYAN